MAVQFLCTQNMQDICHIANTCMPDVFKSPVHSILFTPGEQDTSGDGTVSQQSGAGPAGKVRRIFRTNGFDHQSSYANEDMLKLTHHLICKIAQEAK